MAIGILGVLTISGTTLVYYSNSNARSAEFSKDNSSAYDLAEAGINEMAAILNNPANNALNKYLLPSTTHTYDGGTVQWSGTLDRVHRGCLDVEPHLRGTGEESNRCRSQSGHEDVDREGPRGPDLHAAAQQPVVELHLLASHRGHL